MYVATIKILSIKRLTASRTIVKFVRIKRKVCIYFPIV